MFFVRVPNVTFKERIQIDESPGFAWKDTTTTELFQGKRVVLFSLPGAFTPTCSRTHLPGFEAGFDELKSLGIDDVYCVSVNDSFVMNAWFKDLDIQKVKAIPDGAGEFSRKMGFLVDKTNIGFGMRSWRYAAVVDDGVIEHFFIEPGFCDNADDDPFVVSDVDTVTRWLTEKKRLDEEAKG